MKRTNNKNKGQVAASNREVKTKKSGFGPNCNEPAATSEPKATETATNPKRRKLGGPEAKIRDFVAEHFNTGIYVETAEFAVENLCEWGVDPASLFDANTGTVTEQGREIISKAVEEAWDRYLDLCKDTYNEPVYLIPELLSDRTVMDFLMAKAVAQPWMEKERAEHQKLMADAEKPSLTIK